MSAYRVRQRSFGGSLIDLHPSGRPRWFAIDRGEPDGFCWDIPSVDTVEGPALGCLDGAPEAWGLYLLLNLSPNNDQARPALPGPIQLWGPAAWALRRDAVGIPFGVGPLPPLVAGAHDTWLGFRYNWVSGGPPPSFTYEKVFVPGIREFLTLDLGIPEGHYPQGLPVTPQLLALILNGPFVTPTVGNTGNRT